MIRLSRDKKSRRAGGRRVRPEIKAKVVVARNEIKIKGRQRELRQRAKEFFVVFFVTSSFAAERG